MNLRHPWIVALLWLVPAANAQEEEPGRSTRGQRAIPNLVPLPEGFVRYARLPDGGTQPRLIPGESAVAVLYFRAGAEGTGGDLFLTRTSDFGATIPPGAPVSSYAGAVAAPEGLHGVSIDCDANGLAHVAWIHADPTPTLCYSREKPGGGFEDERTLGTPAGLGRTTALAIDGTGQVCVFYAARAAEDATANRIWMLRTSDGAQFGEPVAVDADGEGVSEQCGIAAHYDPASKALYVLYRANRPSAKKEDKAPARNMHLLTSVDQAETFQPSFVENWRLRPDPGTSAHLVQDGEVTLAAWDGLGEVYWTGIRRNEHKIRKPVTVRDDEHAFERSVPVVCANGKDEVLLAWLERSSATPDAAPVVRWQVWMKSTLAPIGMGEVPGGGVPPAVLARPDGGFTIVY
jgi:hypothetical protein